MLCYRTTALFVCYLMVSQALASIGHFEEHIRKMELAEDQAAYEQMVKEDQAYELKHGPFKIDSDAVPLKAAGEPIEKVINMNPDLSSMEYYDKHPDLSSMKHYDKMLNGMDSMQGFDYMSDIDEKEFVDDEQEF